MDSNLFNICYEKYLENGSKSNPFWGELAKKYNFKDGESLRSLFKHERQRRGIPSKKDKSFSPKQVEASPKVLVLDIETTPLVVFSWGLYNQNLSPNNIIQDWHVMSWSAKWLYDCDMMNDCVTSGEMFQHDDGRIVRSMWKLIDAADILITHNGNNFDLKRLNTRFIIHGLNPPSHYYSIDTYRVAKDNFDFTSGKLDFLNKSLGLSRKIETNFDLWKRCYNGEQEALDELSLYNSGDITALEELYLKVRPWIKNHPNINSYVESEDEMCPKCGSDSLNWKGYYHTPCGKYRSFRCEDCGAIGRSRVNSLTKDKRQSIVV